MEPTRDIEAVCKKCAKSFAKDPQKYWHYGKCPACYSALKRENNKRFTDRHGHRSKAEYLRRKRAEKSPALLARGRRNSKVSMQRRPEQWKARGELRRAVAAGKIAKPTHCSSCGNYAKRIEGHHHLGYDHPLEVLWLCHSCHRIAHKGKP